MSAPARTPERPEDERSRTIEVVGGRFTVNAHVAAGAMGEVFRSVDIVTGAPVALKRMAATRDRERFLDECEILRRLQHPAIVGYVAHGVDDGGRPWLAMEWLDGEDLATRLVRAEASLPETVAWLRGAAEGLGAAHAIGIVHRDVKPENVVLVPDAAAPAGSRIKIVDFGVARADATRRAATRTGVVVGTPAYMAPEQVQSAPGVDARADVFALGAIGFECIADRPAFVADSLLGTFARIIFEDPPPLDRIVPGTPRPLSDLIARMMAKDPSARPADGAAVAAELAALVESGALEDAVLDRTQGPAPSPTGAAGETLADEIEGRGATARAQVSTAVTTSPEARSITFDEPPVSPARPAPVQVGAMSANHCVGYTHRVALLVWGKETTREGVEDARRVILAHAARHREGIGLLTVIESIADPPSAEVRRLISEMLSSMSGKVLRSGVAQEGTGFRAAMVRGVVTGLTLISRLSYPHRVFDNMETTIAWIVEGLPPGPGSPVVTGEVIAAARELRRRFDDHRRGPRAA